MVRALFSSNKNQIRALSLPQKSTIGPIRQRKMKGGRASLVKPQTAAQPSIGLTPRLPQSTCTKPSKGQPPVSSLVEGRDPRHRHGQQKKTPKTPTWNNKDQTAALELRNPFLKSYNHRRFLCGPPMSQNSARKRPLHTQTRTLNCLSRELLRLEPLRPQLFLSSNPTKQ
ncbi:hypothetical protein RchiOBHm_Chr6g0273011 [Rosa chinensis]|uniref:Uncharacterized protein n=1 Tax=Rosa chinensis TaxID=74649 RepID=A0A2P6PRE5_ROSCH|nr:hypothetical protein RchiOBHm_Chr6g0273011 [Rosa chinensis]